MRIGSSIDLCFQGFDDELATLAGKYAPPEDGLLLASPGTAATRVAAGCVRGSGRCAELMRPIARSVAELKRLWVRPAFRGMALGRALTAQRSMPRARSAIAAMKLDTLPSIMPTAVAMYRGFGFVDCEPYYHNPIPGSLYMERAL